MFISKMPAERHAFDKRMNAQPKHHPEGNCSRMIVVRVSVFDPMGKKFQQKLDKKTGEHKKPNGKSGIIPNQESGSERSCAINFRQQMEHRDRENVGAGKGDEHFDLSFVLGLEEKDNRNTDGDGQKQK